MTQKAGFKNITDLKAANAAAGFHWFDPETMSFFKSKVESPLYQETFFVTSEKFPDGVRRFTVRQAGPDGSVKTYGEFGGYAKLEWAKDAAKAAN